jgi:hypothetical protein
MAHRIHAPYDQVFSIVSREWHGLANLVPMINREVIKPILPPIVEGKISLSLDGENVTLDDQKALVADYRFRTDIPEGQRIRPLSVMGKDYCVIDNGSVLAAVESAIDAHGLDAKITTAGTLRSGRNFFLSLEQDKNSVEFQAGDTWSFYLNLSTSHDGTDSLNTYFCGFRTVCYNTYRAGLDSADKRVRIYHTKNATLQLDALPEILVAMRNQQDDMVQALAYLAGIKCDMVKARRIVSGYFAQQQGVSTRNGEPVKFSTRTANAVDGILATYRGGKGNRGETLYDLLNGVTEYYTHGEGTGQKASAGDRAFRANFGGAADHKEAFMALLRNPEARELAEAKGALVSVN